MYSDPNRRDPVQPVEPVQPVQPVQPTEYRQDVVQTDEGSPAFSLAWIVYTILGIVDVLIILRVLFKALAANTGAGFTSFVYGVTDPLVAPFQGIFGTPQASNGSVFELSSVVAIVVYALLAWAIVQVASIAGRQRRTTTTAY
ncbi:MAG TPA: YggT family protein [Ktedonobacterales bacterium]|nr:YggT family protein [Ktedonobacterales bacterium]